MGCDPSKWDVFKINAKKKLSSKTSEVYEFQ